jgi:hypothetical protein
MRLRSDVLYWRLVCLGESDTDEDVFAPRSLSLSADAAVSFERFRQFLYSGRETLEDRECEWWNKGAAQVLRIAGTLTLLEWSWGEGPEPTSIERPQVDGAIALWRDYFWPHSRAALRQMGASRRRSLERRVLVWLRKHRIEQVSIKDVRRQVLGHTLNAKECEALLDTLTSSGWLKKESAITGGRPAYRWVVNPMLWLSAESAESAGSAGTLSALSALSASENR